MCTKKLQKNHGVITLNRSMFSYAMFIYLRCCAHAVGKIAMSVTESQVLLDM
jgi:hypothetical protein